jgi:hypothetical protein
MIMSKTNDDLLGQISTGPRETKLNPPTDRFVLPRGAVIALQQSGGLLFSTRAVLVYRDGRVFFRRRGKLGSREGSRRITPAEVAELFELIKQSGFFDLPRSIGRPSPDGYAYELIARVGRKSKVVEFFDGSIPAEMQPLLSQLKALMTMDETQE